MFKLVSKYKPSGDQPEAIKELVDGINNLVKKLIIIRTRYFDNYLVLLDIKW